MQNLLIITDPDLRFDINYAAYLKEEIESRAGVLDAIVYGNCDADWIERTQHCIIVCKRYEKETIEKRFPDASVFVINDDRTIDVSALRENKQFSLYKVGDKSTAEKFAEIIKTEEVSFSSVEIIEGLDRYVLSCSKERFEKVEKALYEKGITTWFEADDVATHVAHCLIATGNTITFAESCTGGLIASELVKNSGVSSIFGGSFVTYANEIKQALVDVKEETLIQYGAVSSECVREMCEGVGKYFDTKLAIAVSGVAGPDGGSDEKPVGTVYIAVKNTDNFIKTKKLHLQGNRRYIQRSTVLWGFKLLMEENSEIFFQKVPKKS